MSTPTKIAIYGAGGHGREVAWLLSFLEERGLYDVVGHIEDGAEPGRSLNRRSVMSWNELISHHRGVQIVVAVGDPEDRRAMAQKCIEEGFGFATLVHPSVLKSEFVEFGEGVVVCPGCILTTNIRIERHAHINVGCSVSHDVVIGEFSTLAPGARICGHVHIGHDVYIGAGATILNGTRDKPLVIGDGCVIAGGTCVTRSTTLKGLYAGVPAVLKKRFT